MAVLTQWNAAVIIDLHVLMTHFANIALLPTEWLSQKAIENVIFMYMPYVMLGGYDGTHTIRIICIAVHG